MEKDFSLESSIEAFQEGKLKEWVIEYFRSTGKNQKLSDIFEKTEIESISLSELPLKGLKRVIGPEEGMVFPESKEKWERRVGEVMEQIESGKHLPPLIVTNFWEENTISDGNHRFEALLRLGKDKYWVAFFNKKK